MHARPLKQRSMTKWTPRELETLRNALLRPEIFVVNWQGDLETLAKRVKHTHMSLRTKSEVENELQRLQMAEGFTPFVRRTPGPVELVRVPPRKQEKRQTAKHRAFYWSREEDDLFKRRVDEILGTMIPGTLTNKAQIVNEIAGKTGFGPHNRTADAVMSRNNLHLKYIPSIVPGVYVSNNHIPVAEAVVEAVPAAQPILEAASPPAVQPIDEVVPERPSTPIHEPDFLKCHDVDASIWESMYFTRSQIDAIDNALLKNETQQTAFKFGFVLARNGPEQSYSPFQILKILPGEDDNKLLTLCGHKDFVPTTVTPMSENKSFVKFNFSSKFVSESKPWIKDVTVAAKQFLEEGAFDSVTTVHANRLITRRSNVKETLEKMATARDSSVKVRGREEVRAPRRSPPRRSPPRRSPPRRARSPPRRARSRSPPRRRSRSPRRRSPPRRSPPRRPMQRESFHSWNPRHAQTKMNNARTKRQCANCSTNFMTFYRGDPVLCEQCRLLKKTNEAQQAQQHMMAHQAFPQYVMNQQPSASFDFQENSFARMMHSRLANSQ